jgi:hypothetical protein
VELDKLLDKRQADTTSLDGTASGPFDTMKAFEDTRQFRAGNADTCIADAELRCAVIGGRFDRNGDLAA